MPQPYLTDHHDWFQNILWLNYLKHRPNLIFTLYRTIDPMHIPWQSKRYIPLWRSQKYFQWAWFIIIGHKGLNSSTKYFGTLNSFIGQSPWLITVACNGKQPRKCVPFDMHKNGHKEICIVCMRMVEGLAEYTAVTNKSTWDSGKMKSHFDPWAPSWLNSSRVLSFINLELDLTHSVSK